jgi:hypothetical protein
VELLGEHLFLTSRCLEAAFIAVDKMRWPRLSAAKREANSTWFGAANKKAAADQRVQEKR